MSDTSLTALPAHRQAALLAAGELTAVELTELHLARIEALDPNLNAFLAVDQDIQPQTSQSSTSIHQ